MSTLTILALAALGILALFTAVALGKRHRDSGSGYFGGGLDGAGGGHAGCDSGSGGDCGGGH